MQRQCEEWYSVSRFIVVLCKVKVVSIWLIQVLEEWRVQQRKEAYSRVFESKIVEWDEASEGGKEKPIVCVVEWSS